MKKEDFKRYFDALKGPFKKVIIAKLLGPAIGGIKYFFASLLFDQVWNRFVVPAYQYLYRYVKRKLDERKAAKLGESVKDAKNEKSFDEASDNLK